MKEQTSRASVGTSKEIEINISHKMSDLAFFKRGIEKYFVFSQVIEYLSFYEEFYEVNASSHSSLVDIIKKCSRGRIKEDDWINRWIIELVVMQQITRVSDNSRIAYRLSEAGKQSYREQTFQTIYANLLNARYMRGLSLVAIALSLTAIVLNIVLSLY